MKVRVLFFGTLKELAGKPAEEISLRDGATAREVLVYYEERIPELRRWLPALALAVNRQYAAPETKLQSNDEVALLPPVSGGASDDRESRAARRCRIVRERIDTQKALESIKRGEDGAVAVFEGIVRNQTRGRRTLYLDYEAYEVMALTQLESLAGEALNKFGIRDVAIIHRLGRLEIGETSVLIVVASAHRAAAFDACRWLIDTLKRTVPIWKKEYFEDGAVWADGEPFPEAIPRANS
jgi:molybdopterin synthase catalytic subunit